MDFSWLLEFRSWWELCIDCIHRGITCSDEFKDDNEPYIIFQMLMHNATVINNKSSCETTFPFLQVLQMHVYCRTQTSFQRTLHDITLLLEQL